MTDSDRSLAGWARIIERSRQQANGDIIDADGHPADPNEVQDRTAELRAWIADGMPGAIRT